MNNVTRISDLPANDAQHPSNLSNTLVKEQSTNYVPINVHPNPYGISEQNPIMPHQEQGRGNTQQVSEQYGQQQYGQQQYGQQQMVAEQSLPSRDIPMDTTNVTQDAQTQPNYIPPPPPVHDYIAEYAKEDEKMRTAEVNDKGKIFDASVSEIQMALFVAVLFLLFQTSMVRKLMWNQFTWLPILNADGNLNMSGLVLKSFMFGVFFYGSQKMVDFLTSL